MTTIRHRFVRARRHIAYFLLPLLSLGLSAGASWGGIFDRVATGSSGPAGIIGDPKTAAAAFGTGAVATAIKHTAQSSSIALSPNGTLLFNVNVDSNSVSVFRVGSGGNSLSKLDEVPVGREPVCVASRGTEAYVTNAASGTVSVIDRIGDGFRVITEIAVGTEPHGCALSVDSNRSRLFVANHTDGTVSIINTLTKTVIDTAHVGGQPFAVAVQDNRVFVSHFFARLIPNGPGEGFDDGKEGVIATFLITNPANVTEIVLSPIADSGFTADRTKFCNATTNPDPVNETFCPDTSGTNLQLIQNTPQGAYPNQLASLLACRDVLYVPNTGAEPEPPVRFDVNVQALVHVVDLVTRTEQPNLTVNLNAQIRTEPNPANPFTDLGKLFGNDIIAIDADPDCRFFYLVSRGGNYVLKAQLVNGQLNIGAPNNVVRFQTGNIPSGIVVDASGRRAYVNNEVNMSVSILNVEANTVITRDVPSSTPPPAGSFADSVLKGKLTFFTALGVPDNGLRDLQIRNIVPLQFRNKQSANAWSSCASCHPLGLADGVTWIFPDGPRQTIPLDGLYSKVNGAHDARINNWSAARDSVTDFNGNSRAVQGGNGFASDPPFSAGAPNPAIFDHGLSQGGSEALDVETLWAQTVRPPNLPKPTNVSSLNQGAAVFSANCASCHGGSKWTKSQVFYLNNPALDKAFAAGGTARDPGLVVTANQIVQYTDAKVDTKTLRFLEDVNTFNAASPIEIKGAGATIGQGALGVLGFNVPSLMSVDRHAPYFHNGAAQTLDDVFVMHELTPGMSIADVLTAGDEAALLVFLRALDSRTNTFQSDGDIFKDPTRNLP